MDGLAVTVAQEAPIPLAASFACASGEVLALVGPSGGGKTTILRAIAGLYRPAGGRITVGGRPWFDAEKGIAAPVHARRVGLVFQSYALFPHMSAAENVEAALGHWPAAKRRARAREILSFVHLSGLETRRPAALSGGQQQRVAVARALARDPEVLLLDEPFSAVDRATRQRLYREIALLRQALMMPVVLVTHDLDEAMMLADRMCVLHRGRTLQSGTPAEVTTRPASPEVARLVDLRNLFEAVVVAHDAEARRTVLDWAGRRLEARLQTGFAPGTRVAWVVPDGFVVLHRRDRPSRGEHENPFQGVVESLAAIGQTTHVTLRISGGERFPLHFSVPAHVARRNELAVGVAAGVSVLAEGIHLMPLAADAARAERPRIPTGEDNGENE